MSIQNGKITLFLSYLLLGKNTLVCSHTCHFVYHEVSGGDLLPFPDILTPVHAALIGIQAVERSGVHPDGGPTFHVHYRSPNGVDGLSSPSAADPPVVPFNGVVGVLLVFAG